MRSPRPLALVLLLVLSGLAGCAGSHSAEPQSRVLSTPPTSAPAGAVLRVLVISDEYLPVANATVGVVGLGINGTTNPLGSAYFLIAKPGRYSVHVHHAQYYPNVTKVVVDGTPDQVARITLRDAPRDGRYSDYFFYEGLCGPVAYVPPAAANAYCPETPSQRRPYPHWYLGKGLVEAFILLDWPETVGGASAMRVEARFPEAGGFANGQPLLFAEGKSPLRLPIPSELVTEEMQRNGNVIEIRTGLALNAGPLVNAYQDFEIAAEFDYFVEAPDVDPEA